MIRLENWAMVGDDPFVPPELQIKRLHGFVYGHPNHEDGSEITTTRIISLELDSKLVNTRNTTYMLGKPEPEYLKFLKEYNSAWYELFKEYDND